MLIIGLLFGAIHLDSVQTFLARRLTSYLSDELHTTVNIDRVSIKFIKSVVLKGFYVQDLHGDTLLYADELTVSISNFSTKDHVLDIGKLTLSKSTFNLVTYHGENHDNLEFISDYFSSNDTTSSGEPWNVGIRDLALKNVNFRHEVEDDTAAVDGVDFSHLDVRNVNGNLTDYSTKGDSIFVNIRKLSFLDRSGFKLDELSADAKLSSKEIDMKKLVIRTPFTDLHTDLTFKFDSLACFDEFISRVQFASDFKNSTVSFTDIAYFASDLKGIDKSVKLDGSFRGSVNNFKGKNVSLEWGNKSWFRGNINMAGLPYIDDTYFEITADEIRSNKNDVEWIPLPPFSEKATVKVPENLSKLGEVTFKGRFNGFASDFVAYGNINTAIGSISSDLNLKYIKEHKISVYSGRLSATQFDVGKISGMADLGKVSLSIVVKGSGLRLDNINARLEGDISKLEFKNYEYRNIDVDGQFTKRLFEGSLSVNEPNVDFDFTGTVDFRKNLPVFDFIADIKTANLDTLNLFKTNDRTVLKTLIKTHFVGNKPDNIVGSIDIDNTDFIYGTQLFHVNSIRIMADKSTAVQTLDILSDFVDGHVKGTFVFAKLGDAFKEILPRYLPSVILPQKFEKADQNFTYDIRFKNLNVFSEVFLPSWHIAPNTTLTGYFNNITNDISLDITTDWVQFKNISINNFELNASAGAKEMNLVAKAGSISKDDNNFISLPWISSTAVNNRVNYKISLAETDTASNHIRLNGYIDFSSASKFNFKVDSANIVVENDSWDLASENLVEYDTSAIKISSLKFSKSNEFISIDGLVSKNSIDKLGVSLGGFNLAHLNSLISEDKNMLGGIINGNIYVSDVFQKLNLESDLKISNFTLDNDTIGNASITTHYNSTENVVTSNINVIKGIVKIIDINGTYFLNRENDNLDYSIHLNNMYLHPLERYIKDVVSDVHGKVSTDLKLTGSFKKPVLNGTVDLSKTSLIVNYLNTRYSLNSRIKVSENKIQLDKIKLIDENNSEGVIDGVVTHRYFKDFRFDVELQARRFQVLNTTIRENASYYGTANASGYAHFYGPIDNMNMDISLSPEKGTKLSIPLNSSSDLSSSGFITFIDRTKDTANIITRNKVDLSGINLNMNLDMNRNAEIKIIFDEKIGDIITGTGTGSLRLDINTSGAFNMYGTYTIEKGEYLFTLQNLLNKKFIIDPGGRITWGGDPYEANVDLSAIYIVHTSSLYNILQDTIYKQRVPVECKLNLTNKLMNPSISYEITVKGLDPTVESLLQTKLNSEQEINKQMFGLLMFGQFFPTSNSAGQTVGHIDAKSGVNSSASELLSNQVSNWLGQLSNDVDISLNYRAKDTYSPEEIRVMVSKSFLNDRLTIEGNAGLVGNQAYLENNFVGDFYAEYKLTDDGHFRLKGFNRSNADDIIKYSQSPYTQGIGVFYRKDFNKFSDLFKRLRKKKKEEEPPKVEEAPKEEETPKEEVAPKEN